MKKYILGICLVATACAPELRGAKGERCDELSACEEGFECYRGFCVVAEAVSEPDPIVEQVDAGIGQSKSPLDAGNATPAVRGDASAGVSASKDASSAGSAGGGSDDEAPDEPVSKPPPSSSAPAVTGQPATTRDASIGAAADAGQSAPPPKQEPAPKPNPPPATTPPVLDAGTTPIDAGVRTPVDAAPGGPPDAAPPLLVLPKNCNIQDCCDEALRTSRGEETRGKGRKECGCNDPALLPVLVGTLTCTLGGVVGGLL